MRTVGAYEAKTHLGRLLAWVAQGERVRITSRGRPIADLVPVEDDKAVAGKVAQEIRELRKGQRLGGLSIKELLEEGRR